MPLQGKKYRSDGIFDCLSVGRDKRPNHEDRRLLQTVPSQAKNFTVET
jgi:hypothetical protein